MALEHLLQLSNEKKIGLSEQRIDAILPQVRDYISFWRWYPDLFVDFMCRGFAPQDQQPKEGGFKLYMYQRIFLRAAMRHRYSYMVFARAFSKSFLAVLILMIEAILYPGVHLFVTSGGKEQSASIIKEKVEEICRLIPAFENELDLRRGQTQVSRDYCIYKFKNTSWFDNVAARESARGKRRQGGILEECVGIEGDILQQIIIPIMNISRKLPDGTVHDEERVNKSQLYIKIFGQKVIISCK